MKRTLALTMLSLLGFLLASKAEEPRSVGSSANEFARKILMNEVKAESADHSHWMFQLETEKSGQKEIDEVIETKDGNLKRPLSINGHPLTGRQAQAADEKLNRQIRDRNALRKSVREESEDSDHSQKMLKMLPDALLFSFGERAGDTVQLKFKPNPQFRPPDHEARVFQAMEGDLWVNSKQERLVALNGHLIHEVKFGGGLLGHLDRGGRFQVKQTEVASGFWELTSLDVEMNGKALFFKTIAVKEKMRRSDFHQISPGITLSQAADLLHKQITDGGNGSVQGAQ